MKAHCAFLRPRPLEAILAGDKAFEVRCSFGRLACEGVRTGDTLLLKRVGGNVEAVCDVGEVRMYHGLRPEAVAAIAREHGSDAAGSYFSKYTPPSNRGRKVNVGIIEVRNVRAATLPAESTPRAVRAAWMTLPEAPDIKTD